MKIYDKENSKLRRVQINFIDGTNEPPPNFAAIYRVETGSRNQWFAIVRNNGGQKPVEGKEYIKTEDGSFLEILYRSYDKAKLQMESSPS